MHSENKEFGRNPHIPQTPKKPVVKDLEIVAADFESAGSVVYESITLKSHRTGLRVTATADDALSSRGIAAIEYEALNTE